MKHLTIFDLSTSRSVVDDSWKGHYKWYQAYEFIYIHTIPVYIIFKMILIV